MTEGNQQEPPPDAPENKPGALPLPGQRILDPKDKKGYFQPLNPPQPLENADPGEKRASSLPQGPKAVWRREIRKPGTEEIEEVPDIRDVRENPYEDPLFEPRWVERARKGARGLSADVDERRRQRMAALLGVTQGVERLPDSNQIAFSCPVCHERIQCDDTELGKERVCSSCRSEYKLPEDEQGGQIILLRLDPRRGQAEELPVAVLPDERGVDGRSNEVLFQPVEELQGDGQGVVVEWGLEKFETKPESAKFRWLWALVALLLFGSAAGFLLVHVQQSSGRTNSEAASSGTDATPRNDASGALDWASLTPSQVFLMADATVRAYFAAPDLEAKAAVSRGGISTLARMQAYYGTSGGYEPETRVYGDVRAIQIIEEREIGGQKFLMARVNFVSGNKGLLALLKGRQKLEVDWQHAVGYGEMSFERLLDERPARPVLLRAYLIETRDFNDGFTSDGYRSLRLRDPSLGLSVPVYVALGSAPESKLHEAWGQEEIRSGSKMDGQSLYFTVKVRYEISEVRRGFVIDDILAQGWILPDDLP